MNIQFKKGVLELCVLSVLSRKDCYGYELVSDISRHINISEGTFYPLLKRLKDDGLFTTYLQESSEGPPRKYYAISDRGRAYKEELAGEWRDFSAKVNHIIDGTDAGEKGMTPS